MLGQPRSARFEVRVPRGTLESGRSGFADVRLPVAGSVPEDSVVTRTDSGAPDPRGPSVLVFEGSAAPGRAVRRHVTLGTKGRLRAEVVAGLAPGERVIAGPREGIVRLGDGSPVAPRDPE